MKFEEWKSLHKQTISYNGKNCATPLSIVQEMIDNTNLDWSDPNLKICDPCAGFGTYLVLLREKLKQYGHNEMHINTNMLYGYEINKMQVRLLKRLGFKNIYNKNYIDEI